MNDAELEARREEGDHFGAERGSGVQSRDERRPPLPFVGNYRLLELIGSGAMGDVYRAEHVLLGRRVAVKVLHAELVREPQLVERFFAEARAVNLVGHPNILEVTDFGREDGTVWFVMEYLEGEDLAQLLRRGEPSLRRALALVQQLCDGLAAVHEAGIVHRDIKPENVFVVQRDGRDFVKLLDFGIARVPELALAERATVRGFVMGTPPYMAPEQARGLDTDLRTDLYAVGAVLFELITKRPVFARSDIHALLEDVAFTRAPLASAHVRMPAAASADVDRLLARCLAKEPPDRPQSAREIGDELALIAAKLDAWAAEPVPVDAIATGARERAHMEARALLAECRPKWPQRIARMAVGSLALGAAVHYLPRYWPTDSFALQPAAAAAAAGAHVQPEPASTAVQPSAEQPAAALADPPAATTLASAAVNDERAVPLGVLPPKVEQLERRTRARDDSREAGERPAREPERPHAQVVIAPLEVTPVAEPAGLPEPRPIAERAVLGVSPASRSRAKPEAAARRKPLDPDQLLDPFVDE